MPIRITKRPEVKLQDGFASKINSSSIPIVYELASDKFPINKVDNLQIGTELSYNSATRGTVFLGKLDPLPSERIKAFDSITITGTIIESLNGNIFTVKSVEDYYPPAEGGSVLQIITIDVDVQESESSLVIYQKAYLNYRAIVKIDAGFPEYHEASVLKPMSIIDEREVQFSVVNGENVGYLNVAPSVAEKLNSNFNYKGEETQDESLSVMNDNFLTFVSISIAEAYNESDGETVSEFVSEFEIDTTGEALPWDGGFLNSSFTEGSTGWNVSTPISSSTFTNFSGGAGGFCRLGFDGTDNLAGSQTVSQKIDPIQKGCSYNVRLDANCTADHLDGLKFVFYGYDTVTEQDVVILSLSLNEMRCSGVEWSWQFAVSFADDEEYNIYDRLGFYIIADNLIDPSPYIFNAELFNLTLWGGGLNPFFNNEIELEHWFQKPILGGGEFPVVGGEDGTEKFALLVNEDISGGFNPISPFLFQNALINENAIYNIVIEYEVIQDGQELLDDLVLLIIEEDNGNNIATSEVFNISGKVGKGIQRVSASFVSSTYRVNELGVAVSTAFSALQTYQVRIHSFVVTNDCVNYDRNYYQSVFGVNQFQNIYGGNLGKNALRINHSSEEVPRILTDFQSLRYYEGKFIYLNAYIPNVTLSHVDSTLVIRGVVYNQAGSQISFTDIETVINKNDGMYLHRVQVQRHLDSLSITSTEWARMEVLFQVRFDDGINPVTYTNASNIINVMNKQNTCVTNGEEIRWLNSHGAWEHWYFEHEAKEEEETKNGTYVMHDTYNSLGNDFATGDTVEELVSIDARPIKTLFTGWLSDNEYKVLQQIRRSLKVQIKSSSKEYFEGVDVGTWQTTRIEGSTVVSVDKEMRRKELVLKFKLPKFVTQKL